MSNTLDNTDSAGGVAKPRKGLSLEDLEPRDVVRFDAYEWTYIGTVDSVDVTENSVDLVHWTSIIEGRLGTNQKEAGTFKDPQNIQRIVSGDSGEADGTGQETLCMSNQ